MLHTRQQYVKTNQFILLSPINMVVVSKINQFSSLSLVNRFVVFTIKGLQKRSPFIFWRREGDLNPRMLITSHDFQSCSFDRSDISAYIVVLIKKQLKRLTNLKVGERALRAPKNKMFLGIRKSQVYAEICV